MSPVIAGLLSLLLGGAASLIVVWWQRARRGGHTFRPSVTGSALGLVTNFFDTLGIGSFAPTTAFIKLKRLVSDEQIPGTLNVGHALPTINQALIFVSIVEVETVTLLALIGAAALGSWYGSRIVAGLPRRPIQIGIACALLVAVILFTMTNLELFPGGGDATALGGWRFAVASGASFLFGALNALGIGLYAPMLITLSLLGMNPIAVFPIMMGSGALVTPIGGMRFIRAGRFDHRLSLSLAVGGLPGVLLAAFVVRSLPLEVLRWGVVCVVAYAAVAMLRSALQPGDHDATRQVRSAESSV